MKYRASIGYSFLPARGQFPQYSPFLRCYIRPGYDVKFDVESVSYLEV